MTILEQQAKATTAVRESGLVNEEIERMLGLLDQRLESYNNGEYAPEVLEAQAMETVVVWRLAASKRIFARSGGVDSRWL